MSSGGAQRTSGTSVAGIGIDLVENSRMKETLDRWGNLFTRRVFRKEECAYCDRKAEPWRHYAGRFAVKEAVSKAFGTGIGTHIGWLDIEVRRDKDTGAPSVRLSERAQTLAGSRGVRDIVVSLSHTRNYSVAQALLVGTQDPSRDKTGGC